MSGTDHQPPQPRLKLRLGAAAERAVRNGHPWVFADRIKEQNRPGTAGELAVAYDRHDRFLAIGLFDPDSPIALRVLHAGSPAKLDESWWWRRLATPLAERIPLFGPDTDGHRCLNGESDGWPGLVLDRYADVFVLKLYTAAWLPHLNRVAGLIVEQLRPAALVLRFSRNMAPAAAAAGLSDGQLLRGRLDSDVVVFREAGLLFEADVRRGQKTGFFLDQRENRMHVGRLAAGREVLNLFSHAGGFSVHAAAGGARACTDVDLSRHALAAAERNFQLNREHPRVGACRHAVVQADVFAWLETVRQVPHDLVVVDPPSLARRESEKAGALDAYRRLAASAWQLVRPGGVLVAASCSAHVKSAEFFQTVRGALSAG
ncbi:MAG TPA: 23S rRNA (cytosine(2499)-C(5))-methyltransferase, partial [Verrucomicrobiales bacterium]|nr:23S rRNA (cytosine(2499)-C(5))-methyltransferase [Verrucomicrobiales bacterium]